MKIKYSNTIEDVKAFLFYQYQDENNRKILRKKYLNRMFPYLVMSVVILLDVVLRNELTGFYMVGSLMLIIGLLFIVINCFNAQRLAQNQISNDLNYADVLSYNNDYELEIKEKLVVINNKKIKVVFEKNNQSMVILNDFVFIKLSNDQFFIIPRKKIIKGNFDEFLKFLKM